MTVYEPRYLMDVTFLATYLELTLAPEVPVRYESELDLIMLMGNAGQEAYVQLVIGDDGPICSVLSPYQIGGDRVADAEEIGGLDGIKEHFGEDSVFKYRLSHRLRDAIAELDGFNIVHRVDWSTWPMQYLLNLHWGYPSTDDQMLDFIREASQDLNFDELADAIARGNPGHNITILNEQGWTVADKGPYSGDDPPQDVD